MPALDQLPPWSNWLVFAVTALGVWFSGTKLSGYVDLFADRTGIGKVFAGALLLGGATSLPEIATSVTAGYSGAVSLAGNNLIGGVVMQMVILAVLDLLLIRSKPLTFFSPRSALLMQGVMLIVLLALAIVAVATGEFLRWRSVGLWPVLLALAYLCALYTIYRYEGNSRWEPTGEILEPPESALDMKDAYRQKFKGVSNKSVSLRFLLAATGVLVCGSLVAMSGEVIAEQSGLGQGFVGAVFVAFATSLPEVSTTYSAIRFGAYSMAAANIIGTNCLSIALFLPADLAYWQGAMIQELDMSSIFLAALGIIVTAIYLWGVLERRDSTVLGMGWDSALVLIVYSLGMFGFWALFGSPDSTL